MDACRLLLLGPPLVQRGDRLGPINLRKGLALAAYLAVEQRAFIREYLATLLWPDLGQQSALADLRRMLTYLRKTLGDGCITTEGDLVRFDRVRVGVDLAEFDSLLDEASPNADLTHLESAAALYRGAFLEGFALGDCLQFDEWQDGVRWATEERYGKLLETLCRGHLGAGRTESALLFARRWLELDHLNEAAHRTVMEIHAREGRADLVRRQFDACRRALSQEGLEPEEATRELHEAILGRRPVPIPGQPADVGPPSSGAVDRSRRRRRSRSIAAGVAGGLLVVALTVGYFVARTAAGNPFSVMTVRSFLQGDELSRLRVTLRNDDVVPLRAGLEVVFSSNAAVVMPREYVVFADVVRMPGGGELAVEIDLRRDIEDYVRSHGLVIPPGDYSAAIVVRPRERILQTADHEERLVDRTLFFYPGTAPEAAFVLDVTYRGRGAVNEANPLKLFIGDSSSSIRREGGWASFVAAGEGRYYLPVDDVPVRDRDGSGYALLVIHDAGNDLSRPGFPQPGDVGAIYREGTRNLSYGVSNVAGGSVIRPGRNYRVDFSPPEPPPVDAFEVDDTKDSATEIAYAALPVRQRHTFHDEGTGDTDQDWYRILLPAGATITVETYSAGGPWECDTAIDIADARDYLRTGNDKSELDLYSRLAHTNDTGADRAYYFQIKPYPMYDTGINRLADYVVEFRR